MTSAIWRFCTHEHHKADCKGCKLEAIAVAHLFAGWVPFPAVANVVAAVAILVSS